MSGSEPLLQNSRGLSPTEPAGGRVPDGCANTVISKRASGALRSSTCRTSSRPDPALRAARGGYLLLRQDAECGAIGACPGRSRKPSAPRTTSIYSSTISLWRANRTSERKLRCVHERSGLGCAPIPSTTLGAMIPAVAPCAARNAGLGRASARTRTSTRLMRSVTPLRLTSRLMPGGP
jgi:hypothetical protein